MKTETVKETKKAAPPRAPKAVALKTKDSNVAVTDTTNDMDWGLDAVDSTDIVIPKLLIMQSTSHLVAEEKAQFGDLVNSVSGEVLGSCREKDNKPVKFICIKEEKLWVELEKVGDKYEFRRNKERTTANDKSQLEWEENGAQWRRDRTLNYFILLERDLGNAMPFPYVLSFRRSSFGAGKVLSTHLLNCKAAIMKAKDTGQNITAPMTPPGTIFELTGKKTQNDKGTFYVLQTNRVSETSQEGVAKAAEWIKTLRTQKFNVDQSDLEVEKDATPIEVEVSVNSQF